MGRGCRERVTDLYFVNSHVKLTTTQTTQRELEYKVTPVLQTAFIDYSHLEREREMGSGGKEEA